MSYSDLWFIRTIRPSEVDLGPDFLFTTRNGQFLIRNSHRIIKILKNTTLLFREKSDSKIVTCWSRRRWRWTVVILHRNIFALQAWEEMGPMYLKCYGSVHNDYVSKNIIMFITAWKGWLPHIRRPYASNRKVKWHHIFRSENCMLLKMY
jgi:hypothetical protein